MKIPTISERQLINILQTCTTLTLLPSEDQLIQPGDGVNRYEIADVEYASVDGNTAMLHLLDMSVSADSRALDFDLAVASTIVPEEQFITHGARISHPARIGFPEDVITAETIASITKELNQKILEVFVTLRISPDITISTVPAYQQKFKPIVI